MKKLSKKCYINNFSTELDQYEKEDFASLYAQLHSGIL